MSELAFFHQAGATTDFASKSAAGLAVGSATDGFQDFNEEVTPSFLVWKTCRRQILFLDLLQANQVETLPNADFHSGLDAEVFLVEVLCGLRSPLVGETEVFGQFKDWWKALPEDLPWKNQNRRRIEAIFSLVKSVRERVLCGSGSQSYGSLLRRHLEKNQTVDLIGAGHLVKELLPWVQSKAGFRIWCRDPDKAQFAQGKAERILHLSETAPASPVIVVAAPLSHSELEAWLMAKDFSEEHQLFDLRADSEKFKPSVTPRLHLTLQDFSTRTEEFQQDVQDLYSRAMHLIGEWKSLQETKSQIRPYGWDDL
jgi:glutamyl-tRNA reductase